MTDHTGRTETGAQETAARIGLTALSVLFALQLIRVFLPIVFDLRERSGTATGAIKAGVLAIVISLTPFPEPGHRVVAAPDRVLLGLYFYEPGEAQSSFLGQTTIEGITEVFESRMLLLPDAASTLGSSD